MEEAVEVEVARRGQITIPKALRDRFGIEDGQKYGIRPLEGGVLVLTPRRGRAVAAMRELRDILVREGASLEDMLAELRRMREDDGR